jgi:hypothetical protein
MTSNFSISSAAHSTAIQFGTRFNIKPSGVTSEKEQLSIAQNFAQLLVTNLKHEGITEAKQVVINNRVAVLTDTQGGEDVKSDLEASALVTTAKQLAEKNSLKSLSGNCADDFTPRFEEANLLLGKNPLPLPKNGYAEPDPQHGIGPRMLTVLSSLFSISNGRSEKAYPLSTAIEDLARTIRYGQTKGRVLDVEIAKK